ncbi:MAG: FG-GAP repeat domain-containing protein [Methylobacter sp.]
MSTITVTSAAGAFEVGNDIPVGDSPSSVAEGDFNGDQKRDLVVTNFNDNTVSVLLSNGNGDFQLPAKFSVGTNPKLVRSSDLNADGKPDLIVANYGNKNISVLLGAGDGSFKAINYAAGWRHPLFIRIGRFQS